MELLALPDPGFLDRDYKESPLDTLGNPKPGVKRLAGPVEIALPANDSPTAVTYPEPKTPPADKEKPKEPEKPKANQPGDQKTEEKTKPAESLTHGMVCVIRDAQTKQPRWIKRLDFSPRAPRDYLQPDVSYDAVRGRITIRIAADDTQNLPPLSQESPIVIRWNDAGELSPNTTVKDQAMLTAPGQSAMLFADVEADADKKVWVRLTADGYPRAFIYQVRCDRDREHISRERSLEEIRITSPSPGQAFRIPLEKPLPLEFQADAPEDSFQNPDDVIQVTIVADDSDRDLCPEERRRFYSDRQAEVFLRELDPSGELKIETKVGDFKIPLNTGGLKNTKVRILAQLFLAGANQDAGRSTHKAAVPIILAGAPPVFGELITPVVPIAQVSPIVGRVSFENELSGIKELRIGIDRDNSGALEEGEKPELLFHPEADDKWHFSIPTQDIKPGRYTLIVRAVNMVGLSSQTTRQITISPPASVARPAQATVRSHRRACCFARWPALAENSSLAQRNSILGGYRR